MRIWIVNPFDPLPNESDVPLRYWTLSRTFAEQEHEVIWWSSDFSHLTKSKREPCFNTEGFAVRLIETPPYSGNISFARLKNHKAFANGFYREAMAALKSGVLQAPGRIIVSLPPLGVAEQAFKIRDWIHRPSSVVDHPAMTSPCEVIVDIMDAWPESFYRVLPKPLHKTLGPRLAAPLHRSARRTYLQADKISAVGRSYLDLAADYSGHSQSAINHLPSKISKPMFLCYHGADMARFRKRESRNSQSSSATADSHQLSTAKPLRAVYLGAMNSGYDLQTILRVAARWKAEGIFTFQIHFAGSGDQMESLKAYAAEEGLLSENHWRAGHGTLAEEGRTPSTIDSPSSTTDDSSRIVFHGQLGHDAVNALLSSADLALVPNRPSSLVACPYKAGEYAAAGLPMLSCLGGEFNDLLRQWKAGTAYNEGDADSLCAAFEDYLSDSERLKEHSRNARKMAETLFDRNRTYTALAKFILLDTNQSNAAHTARDQTLT